jgi:translation elongation factor EF-Tu-like GTPase
MMIYRYVYRWGIATLVAAGLLSGCGNATPTPVFENPAPTSVPAQPQPPAVQSFPTEAPVTDEPAAGASPAAAATTDGTTTPDGTATVEITATRARPLDLPFLMKIDRVSAIVGKGTLLEGRVANGTLQGNSAVEILGPQGQSIDTQVLAILISTIPREQVTVGDYAGILVESLDATQVAPGMLLTEAGQYQSYEEALPNLP